MFTAGWSPQGFGDGPLVPSGGAYRRWEPALESHVAMMTTSPPCHHQGTELGWQPEPRLSPCPTKCLPSNLSLYFCCPSGATFSLSITFHQPQSDRPCLPCSLCLSRLSLSLSESPSVSDSSLLRLHLLSLHHAICPPDSVLTWVPVCVSASSLLCGYSLSVSLSLSIRDLSFCLPLCPVSLSLLASPSLPVYLYHCPFLCVPPFLCLPPHLPVPVAL